MKRSVSCSKKNNPENKNHKNKPLLRRQLGENCQGAKCRYNQQKRFTAHIEHYMAKGSECQSTDLFLQFKTQKNMQGMLRFADSLLSVFSLLSHN